MHSTNDLPPNWQPDASLRPLLPAGTPHESFCRSSVNPDRYLVSVVGLGVFDTHTRAFLRPWHHNPAKRVQFRLIPLHGAKATIIPYARLIALAVHGRPPNPDDQAHHGNAGPLCDHWRNIAWQTPEQNRAIEAEKQAAKRRVGETNGNTKLSHATLAQFIRRYDNEIRAGITPNLEMAAFIYGVSVRHLQLIVAGKRRQDAVAEIRAREAERRHAAIMALRSG